MPENYDRDLIGYAGQPPDPQWPGGKRLALNFVINYEEGSEPSVPDGDGVSEQALTELAGYDFGSNERVIGHPGRAVGLARFLDHVGSFDDVWICKRLDIARHWYDNHPPEG